MGTTQDMTTLQEAENAWKLIEMLDRCDRRTKANFKHARKHERHTFCHTIGVYPLDDQTGHWSPDSADAVVAWSRDLTVAGIGFIVRQNLLGDQLVLRLSVNWDAALYLRATVKKRRKVHEDFWEIGAEFQQKISVEEVIDRAG